uniref:Putative polyprotein n=1 Tax=Albugo laibachii Nc14 TaxID=890382 RepID=F0WID8_9STRA|nr:putative polyprotein [Albugo laibachii Nc14]|eukprot:CCA21019.1 putative polyprotein [Albugo laibachii Nc14]
MSGIMIMMHGSPVIFKSRLQRVVALGNAEAEYIALSLCVQEVIWIRSLLEELGIQHESAIIVYEDNQSEMDSGKSVGFQSRAKHIDIRHHFIREKVKSGNIEVKYANSKCQVADYLTSH